MNNENCIFCKIIAGELPSRKVYEDDKILAFHDINPAAPVHIICVPKIHVGSLNEIEPKNLEYPARIIEKIPEIAKIMGIFDSGYRVIINVGKDGGQSVGHLHFHVIGGKQLPLGLV